MLEKKEVFWALVFMIFVFALGFVIGNFWDYFSITRGITGAAVNAPSDFINNREILVYPDRIVIKISGATISNYDSTGSMEPVLGEGANGIGVKPVSQNEINVGDIVPFRKGDDLIVHRVISRGADSEGVYFITKGDNSNFEDGKIRFSDIEKVLVGVIY